MFVAVTIRMFSACWLWITQGSWPIPRKTVFGNLTMVQTSSGLPAPDTYDDDTDDDDDGDGGGGGDEDDDNDDHTHQIQTAVSSFSCIYVYMYICICVYMYICIYTYIYIYIYLYLFCHSEFPLHLSVIIQGRRFTQRPFLFEPPWCPLRGNGRCVKQGVLPPGLGYFCWSTACSLLGPWRFRISGSKWCELINFWGFRDASIVFRFGSRCRYGPAPEPFGPGFSISPPL